MRILSKALALLHRSPASAVAAAAVASAAIVAAGFSSAASQPTNQLTFADTTGLVTSLTTAASIDTSASNPFFQSLGTNGRTCGSCHQPAQAWTLTPAEVQQRFNNTKGMDPLFTSNDGSNCADADVSTLKARRQAFSMLLSKGLIRIGLNVPSNAEFDIVDVQDPYCGTTASEAAPLTEASMYRRPLPATNLRFLSTVMWDGRETVPGQAITDDLKTQALDATMGHAQASTPPQDALLQQIVAFEMALFTAQTKDNNAGSLNGQGALGGPVILSDPARLSFCIGINDPLGILPDMPGACPQVSTFSETVFTIYDGWIGAPSSARAAIARGQLVFNSRKFVIDNVAGLNGPDDLFGPNHDVPLGPITGTCTICHDTPNAGNHSVSMALNIGVSDASRRTPDLPLYTLRNKNNPLLTVQTTDPGRAMVTGRWADIGKVKGPVLRALAARAPYFHDGSGTTLADVVNFYDTRFHIGLTAQEKSDLIAFLNAL